MYSEKSDNERNYDLLLNNPKKFIVENQKVIQIIINRYHRFGFIPANEKNELLQYINLRLLDGILQKMKLQYNPQYFVSTYFATVVNNLCKEYLNQRSKDNKFIDIDQLPKEKIESSNENCNLLIDEEIERLERIFRLFHSKKPKVILALKIKFRITIEPIDLCTFLSIDKLQAEELLIDIRNNLILLNKETDFFDYFANLSNKFNPKKLTGDSLRHWTYTKIREIIDMLNQNGRESAYDMETFGTLFEKFTEKISKVEQEFIYISMGNGTNGIK